ncbi:glycosyltransferase family 2 protein [Paenibacillus caui]|uniref:glycosyltransferase family 2 protein n=1 Tax=Paenibacillus caui TaxID=2873927 RepID=UPI001CA8D5AE|nr:glycosyltransferase family 2 protein [Paenibacillus caui]
MNPLVSILIPTFNRPDYFELALRSALNQTYPTIEIVVSDNSTDNLTEQVVARYQSMPRGSVIRYYRNPENIGPLANQQKILNLAQGEFINYLNDDDLFHPQKIEKMMRHMISRPDVVLVASQRRVIDKKGNRIYVPPLGTFTQLYSKDTVVDGRTLARQMLSAQTNYLGEPTTVLFRRNALTEPFGVMAGKQVFFAVDMATWINLLTRGNGVYVVQPLSYLRYHSEQLSQNKYAKEIAKLDYKTFKRFADLNGYY